MTTINNIEDFIRVLDEHPEWLEAVRSRLLPRALLDLPEEFAKFAAEVRRATEISNQRLDRLEAHAETTNQRLDRLEAHTETTNQRLDRLEAHAETTNQRLTALETGLAQLTEEVRQFVAATNQRLIALETDMRTLRNQMGDIRGRIVYDIVRDEAPLLAGSMGFQFSAIRHRGDLQRLTQANDVSWMLPQVLQSFQRADLVIAANNPDGELHYIVVEISYTVNGYDTTRAVRNAEFLTRITGVPTTPAVAGVVLDHHVEDSIAAEDIFWYSIPMGDLRPD
ncbi:MAG: hypothetical protein OXL37_12840 [Chloroflexota bacterium]|nr:hypothetical protein [Chloroflexota bacterium]